MHPASRRLALLLCLTTLAAATPFAAAQAPPPEVKRSGEPAAPTTTTRRKAARSAGPRTTQPARQRQSSVPPASAAAPVALVNAPAEPEFLIGQAEVVVKGNQDPIIRMGLAEHGPTVVEFPASDFLFAVHPGGSNVVTVDESPTLATDHYLVFRAGKDFAAPPPGSKRRAEPQATVSVQMTSGMFVTFMFYPVSSVAKMAHRCVVIYSREEVVAARRAAGLAVNLDGKDPQGASQAAASKRVAESTPPPAPPATTTADQGAAVKSQPARVSIVLDGSANMGAPRKGKQVHLNVVEEARRALRSALAVPAKFAKWSDPAHGLALSASAPLELGERHRLTVVAVKNTGTEALRLVPGQPDLDLVTCDDKGRVVQTQPLGKLHVEATSLGGSIPAGATVYYAVVYETPVLGAAQRLRLSVAQIGAADEPTAVSLP